MLRDRVLFRSAVVEGRHRVFGSDVSPGGLMRSSG
jgi:hypothetical protein